MHDLFLLQASFITIVLYGVFGLLSRNTTCYSLNRSLLLGILLCSVFLPMIHLNPVFSGNFNRVNPIITELNENFSDHTAVPHAGTIGISAFIILSSLYKIGIAFFSVRFILRLIPLIRLYLVSEKVCDEKYTLIFYRGTQTAFSFFNWIFISDTIPKNSSRELIIRHEKAHGRQLHSLDTLLCELYMILFWFNPVAFVIKRKLNQTHEYLADSEVTRDGTASGEYMRLLLLVLEKKSYSGITNHFSYKTIKKRIKMITANKTTTNRKLSYLLLLPALFIIVQAFSLHPDAKENKPSISPIDMKNVEKISLAWGVKFQDPITKHERVHEGIDMAAPEGTKVVASADGIVSFAEFSEKGWGKLVVIRHSESYETWYAHLYSITVKNGERVSKGQQLGSVGSTGKSTGPHLHYEVRKDTKRVNPIDYFDEK